MNAYLLLWLIWITKRTSCVSNFVSMVGVRCFRYDDTRTIRNDCGWTEMNAAPAHCLVLIAPNVRTTSPQLRIMIFTIYVSAYAALCKCTQTHIRTYTPKIVSLALEYCIIDIVFATHYSNVIGHTKYLRFIHTWHCSFLTQKKCYALCFSLL